MKLILRASIGVAFASVLSAAQSAPQPAPTVADIRQLVTNARTAIDAFRAAGGAPDAADHPALAPHEALWAMHDRAPRTDVGSIAVIEALRLLNRAELWDRAHARVESLPLDDPAWTRVPSVLYDEAVGRKTFDYVLATLTRTAETAPMPAIRSAALIVIGRVQRRQNDFPAATRTLEQARDAAPGTEQAAEADGLLYEIAHLRIGMPAPPIAGTPRNGKRPISLESFRGRPIVLVFWGST